MKTMIGALLVMFVLQGCSSPIALEEHFPLNGEVSEVTGVSQDEEPFDVADLEGDIWLASFIFTNCDTVCSPMTFNMTQLQDELNEKDLDYQLVSFTIDPDNDTPEVLKDFGEQFGADFSNWDFVTGYEQSQIEIFANRGFMAPAAKLEGSNQFMHSTSIYLMIGDRILEQYEMSIDVQYEQIVEDVELLQGY